MSHVIGKVSTFFFLLLQKKKNSYLFEISKIYLWNFPEFETKGETQSNRIDNRVEKHCKIPISKAKTKSESNT